MDRDEELLSVVIDALSRVPVRSISGTAAEARDALFDGCRCAAHAIIDRHSCESIRVCHKALYDAGLAGGFYGCDSGIATGLASEVVKICGAIEGEGSMNMLEGFLVDEGRKHGQVLISFVELD